MKGVSILPFPGLGTKASMYDRDDPDPYARRCRVCGCTDICGCPEGCWWVEPDLCSSCSE